MPINKQLGFAYGQLRIQGLSNESTCSLSFPSKLYRRLGRKVVFLQSFVGY